MFLEEIYFKGSWGRVPSKPLPQNIDLIITKQIKDHHCGRLIYIHYDKTLSMPLDQLTLLNNILAKGTVRLLGTAALPFHDYTWPARSNRVW